MPAVTQANTMADAAHLDSSGKVSPILTPTDEAITTAPKHLASLLGLLARLTEDNMPFAAKSSCNFLVTIVSKYAMLNLIACHCSGIAA